MNLSYAAASESYESIFDSPSAAEASGEVRPPRIANVPASIEIQSTILMTFLNVDMKFSSLFYF